MGDESILEAFIIQLREDMGRTPNFEGASLLKVLALEKQFNSQARFSGRIQPFWLGS